MHLLQELRHFIFLYHSLLFAFVALNVTQRIFLNCEGFALRSQATFNGLRCIWWVRLCCIIVQNIFVHSRIHCSCYILLDAVTQTDVVFQEHFVASTQLPDFIYDLDQPRTTYDLVTEAPIATAVTSSRYCRLPNCVSDTRLKLCCFIHARLSLFVTRHAVAVARDTVVQ